MTTKKGYQTLASLIVTYFNPSSLEPVVCFSDYKSNCHSHA